MLFFWSYSIVFISFCCVWLYTLHFVLWPNKFPTCGTNKGSSYIVQESELVVTKTAARKHCSSCSDRIKHLHSRLQKHPALSFLWWHHCWTWAQVEGPEGQMFDSSCFLDFIHSKSCCRLYAEQSRERSEVSTAHRRDRTSPGLVVFILTHRLCVSQDQIWSCRVIVARTFLNSFLSFDHTETSRLLKVEKLKRVTLFESLRYKHRCKEHKNSPK